MLHSKYFTKLLFIFLSLIFLSSSLYAWPGGGGGSSSTLIVDNTPTNFIIFKTNCDNQISQYETVQLALDDANAGDTIKICDGTYEDIKITTNGLTLTSYNSDKTKVTIKSNSTHTVELTGVDGLTLELLTIKQTGSNKAGIKIKSFSDNILIKNVIIESKKDGILTEGNNGTLELQNTAIDADDDGIEIQDNKQLSTLTITDSSITAGGDGIIAGKLHSGLVFTNLTIAATAYGLKLNQALSGGITITDSTISSTDKDAIYTKLAVSGAIDITDSTLNAGDSGINFIQVVNNGLTISSTTINATHYALIAKEKIHNGVSISDSIMSSTDSDADGLSFENTINGGFTLSGGSISAGKDGVGFSTINGGASISGIPINAGDDGFDFNGAINDGISIEDVNITSSDIGIIFNKAVYDHCTLDKVTVDAVDRGLYFNSVQIKAVVTNSDITSSTHDGIYTKSTKELTLKDSCVTTQDSSDYGLDLQINNNKSTVTGNCFYAESVEKLALAKKKNNDFSGNYWDGNSGNYHEKNVKDTSTDLYCSNDCGGGSGATPATLIADYRFDECEWTGQTGEVENNSSDTYDATAKNGANTNTSSDGGNKIVGINRVGSFDGSDDYVETSDAISIPSSTITVMAWVKATGFDTWSTILIQTTDDDWTDGFGLAYYGDNDDHGDNKIHFFVDDYTKKSAGIELDLDTWTHIAATYDGNTIKIFKNGVEGDTYNKSGLNPNYDNDFMIGDSPYQGRGAGNDRWVGDIDEVKVFDGALTGEKIKEIYDYENDGKNYDGTQRVLHTCRIDPIADYHFDECSWDDIGDIKDSSVNNNHGDAIGSTYPESEAKLNQSGYIDKSSSGIDENYIHVPHSPILDSLDKQITIAFWMKDDGSGSSGQIVSKYNSNNGWVVLRKGTQGKIRILLRTDGNNDWIDIDDSSVFDGSWHHIAFVIDAGRVSGYVNGDLRVTDSYTEGSGLVNNEDIILGKYYKGNIDEFKIFNKDLSSPNIKDIYDNENAGKNYDGEERTVVDCNVGLIAEYRFDECEWSGEADEVKDNSANTYDGKAELGASTVDNQNGGINRNGSFSNNYISLEDFPHINTSRTITAWFNTADKTQSGQRIFADDEDNNDGSYALSVGDPGSGKVRFYVRGLDPVSLDSDAVIENDTWYFVVATLDSESMKKKLLIYDALGNELSNTSNTVSGTIGTATGTASLGGETNSGEFRNRFNGYLDEIKLFDKALSNSQAETILNYEKDGKNYDGTNRDAVTCTTTTYGFDTWDTFRDINDRNISTKISAQSFSIFVASLNEDNDDFQEFKGTVCSCVDDDSDTCFKNYFDDQNDSSQTTQGNPAYTISKAIKDTKIDIHWKKDLDIECDALLLDEDNTTDSTDNFAIRPEKFSLTLTTAPYYAGDDFNITAHAYNYDSSDDTAAYNEASNTYSLEANETDISCFSSSEIFNNTKENFSDGLTLTMTSSYTGLANPLVISINEISGSEFALVDDDDKNVADFWDVDTNLSITPYSVEISVLPYEINVTKSELTASTGTDWLYMANIKDMSITTKAELTAFNKQGETLVDFNSSCSAENINITLDFNHDGDNSLDMNYTTTTQFSDGSTTKDETLEYINQTLTIPASNFKDGVADTNMSFNVARNFSSPVNPFKIEGLGVNIDTDTNAKYENSDTSKEDGNATLYFGRVKTIDVKTSDDAAAHTLEVEVYSNSDTNPYILNFTQNSLKWYKNTDHNDAKFGDITDINATTNTTFIAQKFSVIPDNYSAGEISFSIPKHVGRYIMHLNTSPWLWYVLEGYGDDYNISKGSNCSSHPCFTYIYQKKDDDTHTISSGSFNGTAVKVKDRGDYIKTGVKVFR